MKHKAGFNKLSKKTSHRKAMIRNMITSLFRHERITTTKAKAKALQMKAEKMITRAKVDSVHNRRLIARSITDKEILNKLFTEIGPRFVDRNGGYTSIIKVGQRQGDAADMVIIELIKDDEDKADKKKKASAKKAAPKTETKAAKKPAAKAKSEVKKEEEAAPVEESKAEEAPVAEEKVEEVKTEAADAEETK
ncbi:MAG: 50S ribosomal protein L17 [Spirochaetales bacterium]|nr:50S ribosomal protein L17 [Spirochaetales bacterium]